MDGRAYFKKQEDYFSEHEALCKRCGRCCGVETSEPCSNLKKSADGRYHCASYENRFGPQLTVSGRAFTCVPIRDVVRKGLPYEGCGYAR